MNVILSHKNKYWELSDYNEASLMKLSFAGRGGGHVAVVRVASASQNPEHPLVFEDEAAKGACRVHHDKLSTTAVL